MDWSSLPWYVTLPAIVFSSVLTAIVSRMTSKDKVQSQLIEKTVERQEHLDKRYQLMIDNLQKDINRLRDELILVKKELSDERSQSTFLRDRLGELERENAELKGIVAELRAENAELKYALQQLQSYQ